MQGVDQDVREKQGLCLGLSWAGRHPALVLDSGTGQVRVPLAGTVGFRVDPGRRCTGHLAVRGSWKGRVPCPTGTVVTGAAQCPACAAADVFRFAHSFHRTGYAPQALVAYLGQPHWVYLATFADGTTKVGTAADSRRTERLDEQGPVLATFVALAADGAAARVLEDAVTAHAGLPQTVRASAKVNGWVQPGTSSGLAARHARSVDMVREVVGRAPGAAPVQEEWQPPPASAALVGGLAPAVRYPHPLSCGEHGLTVVAAAGPVALVRAGTRDRAVVNLAELTGHTVQLGWFASPPFPVQAALF